MKGDKDSAVFVVQTGTVHCGTKVKNAIPVHRTNRKYVSVDVNGMSIETNGRLSDARKYQCLL